MQKSLFVKIVKEIFKRVESIVVNYIALASVGKFIGKERILTCLGELVLQKIKK